MFPHSLHLSTHFVPLTLLRRGLFSCCIDVMKHCIELLLAALLCHTIKGGESRDSDIADSVSSSDISANFNLYLG
jgi:hypothetical protein